QLSRFLPRQLPKEEDRPGFTQCPAHSSRDKQVVRASRRRSGFPWDAQRGSANTALRSGERDSRTGSRRIRVQRECPGVTGDKKESPDGDAFPAGRKSERMGE